jgi:hypothetical protein
MFFLFVSALGCQCAIDKKIVVLDAKLINTSVDITDHISEIEYTLLSNSKKSPILSRMHSAVFLDSIFVFRNLDPDRSNLFVYDYNGHEVFTISSTGMGPMEVNQFDDFCAKDDSTIIISDLTKSTIYEFNLNTKEFIFEKTMSTRLKNIYYWNNHFVGLSVNGNGGYLNIYNDKYNKVDSFINTPTYFNEIPGRKTFVNSTDYLYLNGALSDTIYRLNTELSLEAVYKIGAGENDIQELNDAEVMSYIFQKPTNLLPQSMKFISYGSVYMRDPLVIVPLLNSYWVLYDKRDNFCALINKDNITNYDLLHNGFFKNLNSIDDDYVYTTINLDDHMLHKMSMYVKGNSNVVSRAIGDFMSDLPSLIDPELPVLVRYKLDAGWHEGLK